MARMGDKVAARRLMQEAGVPVLPGTEIDPRDERVDAVTQVHHHARQIGFPLFIKATAGGGGKGMRLVRSEDELDQSLEAARREAQGAFGDPRLYLEKAIPDARHVEVQILADVYGNVIHLGERECSIQRRHQKLIEEAPSPALDENLRQQMGRIAVRAAAAVNYVNAGTVEFLLAKGPSGHEGFYFLEMNTRLQVEHPVTEMVVDIDIVKEQLRVASGEALRYTQEDIHVKGWAIECRVTAEDPFNDFLPVTGRIISLAQPSGPGIRVDSGNYVGLDVSPYYDPLLGKLVVWGDTRQEAIHRMRRALREYRIIGIPTSIPFHKRVMETPAFVQGTYDTSFLDAHFWRGELDHGRTPPGRKSPEELEEIAAIAAVLLHHKRAGRRPDQLLATPRAEEGTNRANMWKLTARQEAIGR
jgi:acetyl/propionyl-CoA carboxylase alpha subunit